MGGAQEKPKIKQGNIGTKNSFELSQSEDMKNLYLLSIAWRSELKGLKQVHRTARCQYNVLWVWCNVWCLRNDTSWAAAPPFVRGTQYTYTSLNTPHCRPSENRLERRQNPS